MNKDFDEKNWGVLLFFGFRWRKWQDKVWLYKKGVPIFFLWQKLSKLIEQNNSLDIRFWYQYLFPEIEDFLGSCLYSLNFWIFQVTDQNFCRVYINKTSNIYWLVIATSNVVVPTVLYILTHINSGEIVLVLKMLQKLLTIWRSGSAIVRGDKPVYFENVPVPFRRLSAIVFYVHFLTKNSIIYRWSSTKCSISIAA